MESPIETPQPQQKSNRNVIIAVVVAVILCCCCLAFAVAGYYGYQAYIAAQSTIDQLQNIEIPTAIPFDPNDPSLPSIPLPGLDGSDAPQGGLTDDSTRLVAWSAVQLIGAISGCATPTAQGTTITVLQEPNTNGEWVEEWNVSCGDGSSQPYKVTFTPENGVVNVNVELP